MKNTRISRVAAAIVTMIALAAILLAQHNVAQANDEGCNLATVKAMLPVMVLAWTIREALRALSRPQLPGPRTLKPFDSHGHYCA